MVIKDGLLKQGQTWGAQTNDIRSPLGDITNQKDSLKPSRKKGTGTWKKKARAEASNFSSGPLFTLEKRSCEEHRFLMDDCGRQGKVAHTVQGEFISAEAVHQPRRDQ
jgi:hypothetical protein